jgi:hypothetical protein
MKQSAGTVPVNRETIFLTLKSIVRALLPYGALCVWRKYNRQVLCFLRNLFYKRYYKNSIDVPDNCVLLIETCEVHGEVLPGLAKYLLDLGYRVDVVMAARRRIFHSARNEVGVFSWFADARMRIFLFPREYAIYFLSRDKAEQYKHVVINTYSDSILESIDPFRLKPVCMLHEEGSRNAYVRTNKIITLVRMDCFDREPPAVVNAHYFGEIAPREKSGVTEFIAFGNTDDRRTRNTNLVVKICDYLRSRNIENYKIKIVGDDRFAVPDEYANRVRSLGFLSFPELYNEMERVDFILALIDPSSVEYTNKASGTYSLCYGFLKPLLIHKKFAEVGNFNDKNSILYENIGSAAERAIGMSAEEYGAMAEHLRLSERALYKSSLDNLKRVLEADV